MQHFFFFQVADETHLIHKDDIFRIRKSRISERLGDAGGGGVFAAVFSTGRYYCKYCRYFFHGDQVGDVIQVQRLFRDYGILLDDDDIDKLGKMLGDHAQEAMVAKNGGAVKGLEDEEGDEGKGGKKKKKRHTVNYNKNLRTLGVGQLCPECYRPFYCSEDHFDEVQRTQWLSEVTSFWVFMLILWVPLIIFFALPGWISQLIGFLGLGNLAGGALPPGLDQPKPGENQKVCVFLRKM